MTIEEFPFDSSIHLKSQDPTPEQSAQIIEFRTALQNFPLYHKHDKWADDTQLLRFLIARNFNLAASIDLIKGALKWREQRKPSEIESSHYWPDKMSKESETGKIYCPGLDKWGRSVLVLDNTAENTKSVDDQMVFLAWNLEFAIKTMKSSVDKYLVFMHLGNFSFFNTPPLSATKETINMLCNCFPERLGHCIVYQPPSIFRAFFNTVKGFIDAKTASKMVFIIGDVSVGSKNDLKMKQLVGDNWKSLVGADSPTIKKGCSPGYDHEVFWPTILQRLEHLKQADKNSGDGDTDTNIETNATHSAATASKTTYASVAASVASGAETEHKNNSNGKIKKIELKPAVKPAATAAATVRSVSVESKNSAESNDNSNINDNSGISDSNGGRRRYKMSSFSEVPLRRKAVQTASSDYDHDLSQSIVVDLFCFLLVIGIAMLLFDPAVLEYLLTWFMV